MAVKHSLKSNISIMVPEATVAAAPGKIFTAMVFLMCPLESTILMVNSIGSGNETI